MIKAKRIFLPVMIALVLCLTGCQIGNRDIIVSKALGNRTVFKVGNVSCSVKEAMLYLANYQSIYGTSYGISLWNHDFGEEDTLLDYVKEVALAELTQVYCMDLLAGSNDVALDEDEVAEIDDIAEQYYNSLTSDEISYIGASQSEIAEYYEHYALAKKIYNMLTEGVNDEVSDDEARVMDVMLIFVSDASSAMIVQSKLADGEDFATVANNYNELESIQTTITRDDIPEEAREEAFSLDNDEVSGMIKTDDGYYFVKCIDKYNVELTEANKSNIVEKRQKEAFDDVYSAFVAGLESTLNDEVWDSIELTVDGSITTDTFFEVYDEK